MAAISVTNADWAVIAAVKDALENATLDEENVFAAVSVTTSDEQARQSQFAAHPAAIIRYVTTEEHVSPDGALGCTAKIELTLATRVDRPHGDESVGIEEVLRLANAAKNAVNLSPPADSKAFGAAGKLYRRIEWGHIEIDTTSREPWAVCVLPLRIAYIIDSETSH